MFFRPFSFHSLQVCARRLFIKHTRGTGNIETRTGFFLFKSDQSLFCSCFRLFFPLLKVDREKR
jgi:hypothetical protein